MEVTPSDGRLVQPKFTELNDLISEKQDKYFHVFHVFHVTLGLVKSAMRCYSWRCMHLVDTSIFSTYQVESAISDAWSLSMFHTMGTLTLTLSPCSRSWDAPRYSHYEDTHAHAHAHVHGMHRGIHDMGTLTLYTPAMLTLMGCTEVFTIWGHSRSHSRHSRHAHAHGMHRGIHNIGTLTLTFPTLPPCSRSWDAPRYSQYRDTHAHTPDTPAMLYAHGMHRGIHTMRTLTLTLTFMGCTEVFTLRRPRYVPD
uniref:Uncharacterized protein n=1 Tax=Timema genevievae TaxID=629358 RepID=A0A7R9PM88_TIMGE|nr:unnamed protein product [Timema genevievae]